ncbi:MAG TPA: NIPSNAP family protein [Fimbriiglobus sp.]|nr:NIPSNAP family protein [Fimbriiglobus sp.]
MNRFLVASIAAAATASLALAQSPAPPASPARETRVFELRTYYAAEGQLDALNARFRDHALRLYRKHGMTPVGFWSPKGNPDNKLVFLLAYPSRAARDDSWRSLATDPEWVHARKTSDRHGKLVKYIEEEFLTPTDYSPVVAAGSARRPRTFELRVSTVRAADAERMHAQLRANGSKELREQGMTAVGFFTLHSPQPGSDVTLVALLARTGEPTKATTPTDPILLVALGQPAMKPTTGTITATDGKKAEVLRPTDYSPLK